jgi:hypothetical protein
MGWGEEQIPTFTHDVVVFVGIFKLSSTCELPSFVGWVDVRKPSTNGIWQAFCWVSLFGSTQPTSWLHCYSLNTIKDYVRGELVEA